MKQGSADDPFAEDTAADTEEPNQADEDQGTVGESEESDEESAVPPLSGGSTTTQTQSLPYIHARNDVKDGRTQRPVFLREHVEEGIEDLVDQMEAEFGENVYKTDVTEAAMVVAEKNPELVMATLEEWGYGWS